MPNLRLIITPKLLERWRICRAKKNMNNEQLVDYSATLIEKELAAKDKK